MHIYLVCQELTTKIKLLVNNNLLMQAERFTMIMKTRISQIILDFPI